MKNPWGNYAHGQILFCGKHLRRFALIEHGLSCAEYSFRTCPPQIPHEAKIRKQAECPFGWINPIPFVSPGSIIPRKRVMEIVIAAFAKRGKRHNPAFTRGRKRIRLISEIVRNTIHGKTCVVEQGKSRKSRSEKCTHGVAPKKGKCGGKRKSNPDGKRKVKSVLETDQGTSNKIRYIGKIKRPYYLDKIAYLWYYFFGSRI